MKTDWPVLEWTRSACVRRQGKTSACTSPFFDPAERLKCYPLSSTQASGDRGMLRGSKKGHVRFSLTTFPGVFDKITHRRVFRLQHGWPEWVQRLKDSGIFGPVYPGNRPRWSHSGEVRNVPRGPQHYMMTRIGLFIWRLGLGISRSRIVYDQSATWAFKVIEFLACRSGPAS